MDTHITQLPKDILRLIAQHIAHGRVRARWGVYAIFRLVCRRFWHSVSAAQLRDALKRDVDELPRVCFETVSWHQDVLYQGGMRIAQTRADITHVPHFVLMPPRGLEKRLRNTYEHVTTHGDMLAVRQESGAMMYPIMFPATTSLSRILADVLGYLLEFKCFGYNEPTKDVWLCMSTSYHAYVRYLCEEHPNAQSQKVMQGAREQHQISYQWQCGPDTRPLLVGPCPRTPNDAYCAKCTLGVGVFINMEPVNETPLTYNADITKDMAYMRHYNKDHEKVDDMKVPPLQYREAALPADPLREMSETKQIDFYVTRARRVAAYLKEHPHLVPYFHYRSGEQEEALLAFLVWYLLDKNSCPWENLTQWLIDKDYLQVLRDDEDVLFFKKLVDATEKTAKPNALTNWLKKTKRG